MLAYNYFLSLVSHFSQKHIEIFRQFYSEKDLYVRWP